jgi:hypothetical protein
MKRGLDSSLSTLPAPHGAGDPWYKSFWPWLVIALLSSAVIGSCISAYYAAHTRDVVLDHADASD